jgi:Pentapeptide repeats (8 copies)
VRARLTRASLIRTTLWDADLRHADLRGANLLKSHLIGADLRGADLRGANLERTFLDRVRLGGARLAGALKPETVLLQDGFDTSPDGTSEWRAAAEGRRLARLAGQGRGRRLRPLPTRADPGWARSPGASRVAPSGQQALAQAEAAADRFLTERAVRIAR